jgi:hypothetical protein
MAVNSVAVQVCESALRDGTFARYDVPLGPPNNPHGLHRPIAPGDPVFKISQDGPSAEVTGIRRHSAGLPPRDIPQPFVSAQIQSLSDAFKLLFPSWAGKLYTDKTLSGTPFAYVDETKIAERCEWLHFSLPRLCQDSEVTPGYRRDVEDEILRVKEPIPDDITDVRRRRRDRFGVITPTELYEAYTDSDPYLWIAIMHWQFFLSQYAGEVREWANNKLQQSICQNNHEIKEDYTIKLDFASLVENAAISTRNHLFIVPYIHKLSKQRGYLRKGEPLQATDMRDALDLGITNGIFRRMTKTKFDTNMRLHCPFQYVHNTWLTHFDQSDRSDPHLSGIWLFYKHVLENKKSPIIIFAHTKIKDTLRRLASECARPQQLMRSRLAKCPYALGD